MLKYTVPLSILDYKFLFLIGSFIMMQKFDTSFNKRNENNKNTNFMIQTTKEYQKDENVNYIVFVLNPPHWLVLLNAQNVRETEKFKVVLFCQENALEVKERAERSQTCDFSVS